MASTVGSAHADRYSLKTISGGEAVSSFAEDVHLGLTANPKTLPPKYFYDDLGSRLFDAICFLPEYYLTRSEREILSGHSAEIIDRASVKGRAVRLIELGSGSAVKTRFLIDAISSRQKDLHYVPVDIDPDSLNRSGDDLLHAYPGLHISAFAGDYFPVLDNIARDGIPGARDLHNIALFLGSNIGNFDPDECRRFMRAIRAILRPGDALLVGADLKKGSEVLVPAYDDGLGVTAAFNRNLLVRINRELDGDFDISQFDHMALYSDTFSRVEMHLVSREPQEVRIGGLNLTINFDWRESIHTESSYKFDVETLSTLAAETGFSLAESWFDGKRRFSFNLFLAAG
jgi:L-histidine Nalpha-methyltransferase